MIIVANINDPEIADYRDLKDVSLRKVFEPEHGLFIAESALVIEQALRAGFSLRSLLVAHDRVGEIEHLISDLDSQIPIMCAEYALLQQITGFHVHRGVLASVQRKPPADVGAIVASARRIVVLESLVDHTNVGAIFRSAAALGWDGILMNEQGADPLYRRSVRVSMGSVLTVPWARIPDWPHGLQVLTEANFGIFALTPHADAKDLATLPVSADQRIALVLGTEGEGLAPSVLQYASAQIRIPMSRGIDSLNVGAAAAIALWQLR